MFPLGSLVQVDSNLPILKINTMDDTMVYEPKVTATMQIVINGLGKRKNENETPNEFIGLIGIEFRGLLARFFLKTIWN